MPARIRFLYFSSLLALLASFFLFSHTKIHASTLHFPHTDHQGSVIAVTDENGDLVSQTRYLPYGGDRTTQGNTDLSDRQYTSQIKDQESGVYYYNARYYDPMLAVFISPDKTDNQLNRFTYVRNNPINYLDPTGYQCESITNQIIRQSCEEALESRRQAQQQEIEGLQTLADEGTVVAEYFLSHARQLKLTEELVQLYRTYPAWFDMATRGDFSAVPPMGFASPTDMIAYTEQHGLEGLFILGAAANADVAMLTSSQIIDDNRWGALYQELITEINTLGVPVTEVDLGLGYYGTTVPKSALTENFLQNNSASTHGIFINSTISPADKYVSLSHEYYHVQQSLECNCTDFGLMGQNPDASDYAEFEARFFHGQMIGAYGYSTILNDLPIYTRLESFVRE